jgi:hypothetical protein
MKSEIRILSPIAILGYGINEETLKRGMAMGPSMIGVDSGSTDSGAHYLGSGTMYQSRTTMKRDLGLCLDAARAAKIPLLVGSAGLAGSKPHVAWLLEILHELAKERGHRFKLAVIHADQEKAYLQRALSQGRVKPFTGVAELSAKTIEDCGPIVAQMGTSPYVAALEAGAEVIIAGRSCDSAIFGSFAVWKGFDRGLALHMGKILECAAMSAMPPTGRDPVLATLRDDEIMLQAPNPERRVTPRSVSSHMVYEVEHPYLQEEPEGQLDFSAVEFEEADGGRATILRGTRFHRRDKPTHRFEGAALRGYRSIMVGATRDPALIAQIDAFVAGTEQQTRDLEVDQDFKIDWKLYGRDAVLGASEPMRERKDLHELGMLVQVLAATQERAHDVAALLEARMIGFAYPGAKTRTAHIAYPFAPLVTDAGGCYHFSVMHIVETERPEELLDLFPIEYRNVGGARG